MPNAGFQRGAWLVHQEDSPRCASLGVIIALVVSAAFWIATGIILLILYRRM